ncbi:MAG: hypothetical protein ACE15C_14040 [Phycisphaerae bacterium]
MRRAGILLAVSLLILAATGCSRVISEGIEEGLGPTAKTLPLDPAWPAGDQNYLARYKNFEIAPVASEFPPTPREFLSYLPVRLSEQFASKDLPMGKPGKTLLVRITIMAYQPAASYEKALGPTEEVVARVELVDKDSGALVGKAICIGRTYQSVGLGTRWKAWGLSRAIVNKWIDSYYPKEGRVERAETKDTSQ